MHRKIFARFLFLGFLLGSFLAVLIAQDFLITLVSRQGIYSDLQALPARKVALVLGSTDRTQGGTPNTFFYTRIKAAADIFFAGKCEYILASGDNALMSYNEPIKMKKALEDFGVPSERIILDYAGFSTLDSIIRAKEVFGLEDCIVVSQEFHLERALFIADFTGLHAIGYPAADAQGLMAFNVRLREYFARIKAFLDLFFLNTQAIYLGDKITIP